MEKIPDSFNGYLKVDEDIFVYNVSNSIVTLLPAQSDPHKRYEAFNRINSHSTDLPEYLYGEHSGNLIAILRNNKFNTDPLGLDLSIRFATPLIMKAAGNADGFFSMLTQEWNKFHAITFCGGNINSICMPQVAIEPPDKNQYLDNNGTKVIKIRPWNDYSRTVEFEIDKERVTLMISVSQSGGMNNAKNLESYSLGELNSFIRLSFDNAQDFEKIEKYYIIAKSLIAILTKQNNIYFQVYLSQRNSDNLYFKTADCKIFDRYANYSSSKYHNVIPLFNVIKYVPNLIDKIVNNEVEHLLALLPEDNKMVNKISITNIQDLCTALEVAYNWNKRDRVKDSYIEELKRNIKKTIEEFNEKHPQLDIQKQTTISSAFQYLDNTLKGKILTLYKENYEVIDMIISKCSLPPMSEENIASFVKLRNGKTHSGTFDWGDSANLYMALFALVYVCLFQHVGIPKEEIKSALLKIF